MKKLYRFIFFLIGVAGVVFLAFQADITHTDWNDLFDSLLPLVLLGQLLIWLVIYGLHAKVYRMILGTDAKGLSFLRLYKIVVAGLALNSVTPAGLVGGEPYRILELKRYCSTEKATSSTLTFTIFYIMGHVLLWFTGSVLYFIFGCPGEIGTTILLAIVALAFLWVIVSFTRNPDQGFILTLFRFFSKVPIAKKKLANLSDETKNSLAAIDDGVRNFNRQPARFRSALLLEFAARLLEAAEYFLILRYLGEHVSFFEAMLVMSVASLIGNLLFIIPMQAGTREGGMILALSWLSIDSSAGIRTGIIYRARDLICIFIGILLILIEKRVGKEENT